MVFPKIFWDQIKVETCLGSRYHEDTDLSVHLANHIKILKAEDLVNGVVFRPFQKPGGLLVYVWRWLDTVIHGWQIRGPNRNISILPKVKPALEKLFDD